MRLGLVLIAGLASVAGMAGARADVAGQEGQADALGIGAAVGAGGQGEATYGALELRLDAYWRGVRIGLGARGVWDDGVFRRRDWARLADAVRLVRQLEARTEHVAIAAGALAPGQLARVVDGHRASLDDRLRTGARGALTTAQLALGLEIDDVLDPALVGGALAWQLAPPWGVHVAGAVDPTAPGGVTSVLEAGGAHRWEASRARAELGASVIAEPRAGLGAVVFGAAALEAGEARWSVTADVRAGNGTNGAAFGPLYRLERWTLQDQARAGVGAGLTASVAAPAGWLAIGGRARPGLGPLGTLSAGTALARHVQAAGWVAATPAAAAGAAELRVAWARHLFSALQLARMYETDEMPTGPRWSATVWFGAVTE